MDHSYETPFTQTEIHTDITSGDQNRAPGRDGLELGFYKATWPIIRDDVCLILDDMFSEAVITIQQKQRTTVCLPKTNRMLTPADQCPITLLKSDYKIVTPNILIIAQFLNYIYIFCTNLTEIIITFHSYAVTATQLTTFIHLCSCNSNTTIKMAAIAAETCSSQHCG
jgi:hypothetical protein